MKLLPWVVLGLVCWAAWRLMIVSRRRSQRRTDDATQDRPSSARHEPAGDSPLEGPERMVQCATCGVHLPASEGVFAAGKVYCSQAHRRASDGQASRTSGPDAEA